MAAEAQQQPEASAYRTAPLLFVARAFTISNTDLEALLLLAITTDICFAFTPFFLFLPPPFSLIYLEANLPPPLGLSSIQSTWISFFWVCFILCSKAWGLTLEKLHQP